MSDAFLKNCVRFEADGVEETLGFQKLVDVRGGKGGIPPEVAAQVPFPVTFGLTQEHHPLSVGKKAFEPLDAHHWIS